MAKSPLKDYGNIDPYFNIFGEFRKFSYGTITTASDPSLLSVRIFGNVVIKVINAVSSAEGIALISRLLEDYRVAMA
jgi:hypothetical protein